MKFSHHRAKLIKCVLGYLDVALVMLIFLYTVAYVRSGDLFNLDPIERIEFSAWHFFIFLSLVVSLNRVFVIMGMYNFRKSGGWINQLWQISIASTVAVVILLFAANLISFVGIDKPFPVLFWASTVGLFVIYRSVVFGGLYWTRRSKRNIRNVVIVGVNPRSISLYRRLENPDFGYNIVGFIDNKSSAEIAGQKIDKPILCDLSEIEQLISNRAIDIVLLALPVRSYYDKIAEIIKSCAIQGIETRIITDIFDMPPSIRQGTELVTDSAFISYDVDFHAQYQYTLKRAFDLLLSSTAIIVLSPVFLLIAFTILVKEGRPVLFIQKRIGMNKRHFNMLKFRTMVRNAEQMQRELEEKNEADGAAFKIKNDPRITQVGRFLRQTSLDEIPQFFNVFVGSMSIVGPRPLPLRDFKLFYRKEHRRRFSVKPGITGLWQVAGRDESNFDEWMSLDLEYVDNWSLILDVNIFMKTFIIVLLRKGAC